MPELPEVQTIVDDLNKKVLGREIVAAWFDWPKFQAIERMVGYKIQEVRRLAKNILIYFNNDQLLLIHQKMTGHLLVGKWKIDGKSIAPLEPAALKERVNGYVHFILTLDDGRMIGFSDLRKFGKVAFGLVAEIENLPELKKLGPDALDPHLNFETFKHLMTKKNQAIHQVLMDQEVVAGIGNIYANDILHEAGIHPFKIAKKLKDGEIKKLLKAAKKILKLSLKLRGTSIDDYRDTAGQEGCYGQKRLVYQREGEKCPHCGHIIKRVKRGGRSAFFCAKCQIK